MTYPRAVTLILVADLAKIGVPTDRRERVYIGNKVTALLHDPHFPLGAHISSWKIKIGGLNKSETYVRVKTY